MAKHQLTYYSDLSKTLQNQSKLLKDILDVMQEQDEINRTFAGLNMLVLKTILKKDPDLHAEIIQKINKSIIPEIEYINKEARETFLKALEFDKHDK